jgi:hypothetical protein
VHEGGGGRREMHAAFCWRNLMNERDIGRSGVDRIILKLI